MASTITMLTRLRRHRRVVRRTPGAVVNVFSNRSVFTRARLLRGGPLCPTPKELQCQEARQNAPPERTRASSWYAATTYRAGGGKEGIERYSMPSAVVAARS